MLCVIYGLVARLHAYVPCIHILYDLHDLRERSINAWFYSVRSIHLVSLQCERKLRWTHVCVVSSLFVPTFAKHQGLRARLELPNWFFLLHSCTNQTVSCEIPTFKKCPKFSCVWFHRRKILFRLYSRVLMFRMRTTNLLKLWLHIYVKIFRFIT